MSENKTGKAGGVMAPPAYPQKIFIETYGCQMNVADSEVVYAIMEEAGYSRTSDYKQADVIFLNTCSVREKAEQTVRNKLSNFSHLKRTDHIYS